MTDVMGPIVGFDGAADDVTVVVLHRRSGAWQLESTEGPAAAEMAAWIGEILARSRRGAAGHPGLAEQVNDWLAGHSGIELDAGQQRLLQAVYAQRGAEPAEPRT